MPAVVVQKPPAGITGVAGKEAHKGNTGPTIAHQKNDRSDGENEVRNQREFADAGDDRGKKRQAYREQRHDLGFAVVGNPRNHAGPCEQQRAIKQRAGNDTQRRDVMSGVGGEIDRRESAGKQHLREIVERLLDVAALPPCARSQQESAGEVEQRNFSARAELGDDVVIGVIGKKCETRQKHHHANAHEPERAKAHFKRGFFPQWRGARRRR